MIREKWKPFWDRYQYALLIFVVGLLLLCLPGKSRADVKANAEASSSADLVPTVEEAEQRLEQTLREIDGVGRVHVLLSYRTTEERQYVSDEEETVVINIGSGKQEAVLKRTIYPQYQGAVIVCDGGGNAATKLSVLQAVAQFTGLRTDQISVLPYQHK